MALFFAPQNLPFAVALLVMLGLAALEMLAVLLAGGAFSEWLDGLLDSHAPGDSVLGWLHVGQVPILMLIILFLTAFGLAGLLLQFFAAGLLDIFLPGPVAAAGALAVAVPAVRGGGFVLAKILPKDESTAVSLDALVGRAGVIIGAAARAGCAAQVRVRDEHGRNHYVLAEPDMEGEVLEPGAEVLLVRRLGGRYRAIANPHAGLIQP